MGVVGKYLGADGRWLGRYIGDADWDSEAVVGFLQAAIAGEEKS